jgi:hypothetical protein
MTSYCYFHATFSGDCPREQNDVKKPCIIEKGKEKLSKDVYEVSFSTFERNCSRCQFYTVSELIIPLTG